MIERLLQKDVQDFISKHAQDDAQQLLLKYKKLFDLPMSMIVWQISGRSKARVKLPLYYNSNNIVYPPGLNLEQSSSEKTASFKASILNSIIPHKGTLLDLTGGFGVDSYFFSKVFKQISYVEPNAELIEYACHNHKILNTTSIQYHNSTAEKYLKDVQEKFDCIFVDPSRRKNSTQKVFNLSDCEPDVTNVLPQIFKASQYLLVKTSPLLDIQQGLRELKDVKRVWVVSVDNECKELLFLCEQGYRDEPVITAVNLDDTLIEFSFKISEEKKAVAKFSNPLSYLYEPNASILKSGAFKLIADRLSLFKIHPSTHFYTADFLVENFPGRIFRIEELAKPDLKNFVNLFPEGKANVITRNYPLTPEALKRKLNLKDGGDHYLLGFSGQAQKFLVAATRLK